MPALMLDLDIWRLASVESHSWDETDRQLVHALVIAPSAPSAGRGLPGQRGGPPLEPGPADIGLLALPVARGVAIAGIGDAGLPGTRVGLLRLAPDGHRPVGQHQRR